jgi:hypothetical protein
LVAEIGLRFKQGDSATEPIARLGARLTTLTQLAAEAVDLPPDVQEGIATLLTRIQETVALGDEWLARTGPELAAQHLRQRLRRVYGVS